MKKKISNGKTYQITFKNGFLICIISQKISLNIFRFLIIIIFLCVVLRKSVVKKEKKMIKKSEWFEIFLEVRYNSSWYTQMSPLSDALEQNRKSNFPLVIGGDLPSFFPGSF